MVILGINKQAFDLHSNVVTLLPPFFVQYSIRSSMTKTEYCVIFSCRNKKLSPSYKWLVTIWILSAHPSLDFFRNIVTGAGILNGCSVNSVYIIRVCFNCFTDFYRMIFPLHHLSLTSFLTSRHILWSQFVSRIA